LILAAAIGVLSASSAAAARGDCPVPERFYPSLEPALSKTGKALSGGREVMIAVLGGASTLGGAAGSGDFTWPARMASVLGARLPAARIKVANLSVARQTARRAADRLRRDVLPLKPTLVIWETGTMEAVHGTPVEEFRNTVQAGIDELRAVRVELILMDMQFSRDTQAIIDFEPYLTVMRELADANDVPLFRRHEVMRHWAESGTLSLRAVDDDKRRQVAVRLYDCIGRAVAELVTRGLPAGKAESTRR
jgi:hypothetical protein